MLDFAPTEEHRQFQRTVRDFLKRECSLDGVREAERSPLGYDAPLYRKMASLGWLAIGMPQEMGGAGGDWVTQALLYEEMGRALSVTAHFPSAVVATQALLKWGMPQQRDLLARLASGEWTATWVWNEHAGAHGIEARVSGNSCTLHGVHQAVVLGHCADALLVVAAADTEPILCLVEAKSAGLHATSVPCIGGVGLTTVEFRDAPALVLARRQHMLLEWQTLMLRCRLMLAAEMLGGAEAALEIAVDYAKHRVAFGRPIGAFQALQHKLANMKLAVEGARAIVYYGATLLSQGKPSDAPIAAAQLQAAKAYRQAATEAVQVFGGIGVMDESPVSMYFRRAKALELLIGPVEALQERIAAELEDPASREAALTLLR